MTNATPAAHDALPHLLSGVVSVQSPTPLERYLRARWLEEGRDTETFAEWCDRRSEEAGNE